MDTSNNPLADLKDIHLPNSVSVFPLSIGWYILIVLLIIGVALLLWWRLKIRRQQKQRLKINQLLDEIESTHGNTPNTVGEVSILLKRVAATKFPKQDVHKLLGNKWLEFLDKTGKTNDFTIGAGRSLLDIYKKQELDNPSEFFAVIRKWLKVAL